MIASLKNYFSFFLVVLVLLAALSQGAGVLPDTQLLLILITFALIIFFLTLNSQLKLTAAHLSFSFLLLLALLATFFSIWQVNSLFAFLLLSAYFIFFIVAANLLSAFQLRPLAYFVVFVGTLEAAWFLAASYVGKPFSFSEVVGLLALTLPVLGGLFIQEEKEVFKFGLGLAFMLKTGAFYLALSKSGWPVLTLWQAAFRMIANRPLVGFGPGSFGTALPQFQTGAVHSFFVHNTYLQFAAENGLLALAALLVLFGLTLRLSWKNIKTASHQEKYLRVGILVALVAFLAHNIVDYTWYLPAVSLLFWLLAGVSVSSETKEEVNQDSVSGVLLEKELTPKMSLKRWLVIVFLILALVPLVFAYIGTNLALQADLKLSSFNYSEGRRLAQLAVRFFPFNAEAYDTLAQAYAEPANPKKYIKEAIKAEKTAIKLRPTWPFYYARLADYLALANVPVTEVWRNHQKAIKLYPLEPQLKVKAANQLLKLGEHKKAVSFYQQAIALSRIYQANKQTAASLKTARSDVSVPVRAIGLAYLGLAKSYAHLRELKRAKLNLKEAKRILGPVPGVFFTEGLIAEKQNKLADAAGFYSQAMKKSLVMIPEQNYRLALVWLKLGQKEKAVQLLKKIVSTEPDYVPAQTLLKRVRRQNHR